MSNGIAKRDYLSYVNDLLPTQFQSATNTKALLQIFLEENQEFQNELQKLFEVGLDLETATGYQLEIIAKLSGVYREDSSDEELIARVKFKRTVDNGSGTTPEILRFLKSLTRQDNIKLFNHYPASFLSQIDGGGSVPTNIADMVDAVSLAGVNAHTVVHFKNGIGFIPSEKGIPDERGRSVLPEKIDVSDPDNELGILAESYKSKNYI